MWLGNAFYSSQPQFVEGSETGLWNSYWVEGVPRSTADGIGNSVGDCCEAVEATDEELPASVQARKRGRETHRLQLCFHLEIFQFQNNENLTRTWLRVQCFISRGLLRSLHVSTVSFSWLLWLLPPNFTPPWSSEEAAHVEKHRNE